MLIVLLYNFNLLFNNLLGIFLINVIVASDDCLFKKKKKKSDEKKKEKEKKRKTYVSVMGIDPRPTTIQADSVPLGHTLNAVVSKNKSKHYSVFNFNIPIVLSNISYKLLFLVSFYTTKI